MIHHLAKNLEMKNTDMPAQGEGNLAKECTSMQDAGGKKETPDNYDWKEWDGPRDTDNAVELQDKEISRVEKLLNPAPTVFYVDPDGNVTQGTGDGPEKQDEEIGKVEDGEKKLDSNLEKGNYGEMKTDQDLREKGYQRISLETLTSIDDPGHRGIDGVYCKEDGHPKYIIVDAKYGTAKLRENVDGRQMSQNWIDQRLDEAVGKEKADEIRMEKLSNPDQVEALVAHIGPDGNVTYDRLDENGNVVEKDVELS